VDRLTYEKLISQLRDVGLEKGDTVHVQSDLLRIGPVDAHPDRESILKFFLAGFFEVLGEAGTLTVGTSFEDYARFGTPFVLEESPSRQGTFSEYVRKQVGAVRSLHPIVSVTGIGRRAEEICGGSHFEGFGYASAWGRLHRAGAKILAFGLGVDYEGGTTFFHYVERLYGVPYQYIKVYATPVFARGQQIEGTFTMSVRYLDFGIVNDTLRFKRHLVATGHAIDAPIGRGRMMCASCDEVVQEGIKCLDRDRYFLLATPPRFRSGEIPTDGTTGVMRTVYDKAKETGS
jgi:aminoglycoside 3-N-acetyltransferase